MAGSTAKSKARNTTGENAWRVFLMKNRKTWSVEFPKSHQGGRVAGIMGLTDSGLAKFFSGVRKGMPPVLAARRIRKGV